MLRQKFNIKTNSNNTFNDYYLDTASIENIDGEYFITLNEKILFDESNSLLLIREDGEDIKYEKTFKVNGLKNNRFSIGKFNEKLYSIVSCDVIETPINFNSENKYILLCKTDKKHNIRQNRVGLKIKEEIKLDIERENIRRCSGDNVIFNDLFLYNGVSVENGDYILDDIDLSNTAGEITVNGLVYNVYIPFFIDRDSPNEFFIIFDSISGCETAYELLINNVISIKNEDYFLYNTTTLQNGEIFIRYEHNFISLCIGDIETVGFDLDKEYNIKEKIKIEKDNSITSIIDYEKQQFKPFIKSTDGHLYPAKEIEFNLHFRERDYDSEEMFPTPNVDSLWNNYTTALTSDNKISIIPKYNNIESKNADLLGNIGFSDEDILNNSKSLQKTFIRVMFFDTPYRGNQSMLFYNTIFLDSSKLFNDYLYLKSLPNFGRSREDEQICGIYPSKTYLDKALTCQFKTYDKYKKKKPSEGFYLYMFPSILDKNTERTIYMKVEFNHAKFGKKVTMSSPYNDISFKNPGDIDFPLNYYDAEEDRINVEKIVSDTYIPIKVKYNSETNEYMWYCDYAISDDDNLRFNLWEVRTNYGFEGRASQRGEEEPPVELKYDVKLTYWIPNRGIYTFFKSKYFKPSLYTIYFDNNELYGNSANVEDSGEHVLGIIFNEGVEKSIPKGMFNSQFAYRIWKVDFDDSIAKIGAGSFMKQSIEEIKFPSSCTSIGESAFNACWKLRNIDLSACTGLTEIKQQTFQGCALVQKLLLPNNLAKIKSGAFNKLRNISEIKIPNNCFLGRNAFGRCYSLKELLYENNNQWFYSDTSNLPENNNGCNIFKNCNTLKQTFLSNDTKCLELSKMFINTEKNMPFYDICSVEMGMTDNEIIMAFKTNFVDTPYHG